MSSPRADAAPLSVLSGRWTLPLLALWVAFSCSRWFGIPGAGGLPDITLERLFFGVLVGYSIAHLANRRRSRGKLLPVELGLGALVIVCLLSAYVTGGLAADKAGGNLNLLSYSLIYPTIAFLIVVRTRTTLSDLVIFSYILTVFAIYLGVTAVLERSPMTWAVFPPSILDPSEGIHFGRSRGPWLQAAFNGTVMTQLFPIVILTHSWGSRAWRAVALLTLGLLSVGVFLTDTRACLLGLVAMTLVGALVPGPNRRIYRTIVTVLIVAGLTRYIVGAVLVPRMEDTDAVSARGNLLLATFEIVLAHPLVGTGFGTFLEASREYYNAARVFANLSYTGWSDVGSHSTFLTPLAEIGLVAGGSYFFLVCRALVKSLGAVRVASPDEDVHVRGLLVCNLLVGIPFLLNGFTNDFKWALTPNALFWIAAAFSERYVRLKQIAPASVPQGANGHREVPAHHLVAARPG